MISTISVGKSHLSKLPDDVLRLIGMGQYTLYVVELQEQPDIRYILRTGEREFFFLKSDGEPVYFKDSMEFNVQSKVIIDDIKVPSVVPNFNRL